MTIPKRIAIFGFGKEGVACANYLGQDNSIAVFDDLPKEHIEKEFFKNLKSKNVDFYFGGNFPKKIKFDVVVRSPGVRPIHKLIREIVKNGAVLTSATQIFFDHCNCQIIGVTGTKGKGTTASLIFQFLKTQNKSVFLAGNIGTPAVEILPKLKRESLVILELSSFQLIDLLKSPHVAVVLMITREHLDWHQTNKEYQKSKESIVSHQTSDDFAIINSDFAASRQLVTKTKAKVFFFSTLKKTNGLFVKKNTIVSQIGRYEEICSTSKILLPGKHNLQNVLAATAVAKIYKIQNNNIIKVLSQFKGLPHRMQYLGQLAKISFYNDSYSTIPETTIAAAESIPNPKILILGGSSKRSDFSNLAKKIVNDKSIKAIVLVGQEAARIKRAIENIGHFERKILEGAKNMKEIVEAAYHHADPGDAIILSPACASYDMFKNYQDRGLQFIKEVKRLWAK